MWCVYIIHMCVHVECGFFFSYEYTSVCVCVWVRVCVLSRLSLRSCTLLRLCTLTLEALSHLCSHTCTLGTLRLPVGQVRHVRCALVLRSHGSGGE
jgi:DNA-binding IclR family transcriptional regulator